MADIINLNKARKAKTKQADKAKAEENRVVFGTSTKLKRLEKARQQQSADRLEAQKLEPVSQNNDRPIKPDTPPPPR